MAIDAGGRSSESYPLAGFETDAIQLALHQGLVPATGEPES